MYRYYMIDVILDGKFLYYHQNEKYQHVSFVNGVYTSDGGKHVDYIVGQITKKVIEKLRKKYKDAKIQESYIKDMMWIFIKSTIENPEFSSQTKEELVSKKEKFGSTCNITDVFVKKIMEKLEINEEIAAILKTKETRVNETDQKKKTGINIPKLDDANRAGSKEEINVLILTEGDSAKAFAISGLSIVGRDYYGAYPLRGKLLNVRDANQKQILANKEIMELKQIIGLQINKEYNDKNISELRYGSILILTDADVDGSHIKGLLFNFFEYFWPSLFQINGFIKALCTPVVKVSKKSKIINFILYLNMINGKRLMILVNGILNIIKV